MPTYQLTWTEAKRHVAFVRAASESAARQAWIDRDYTGEFEFPGIDINLGGVKELTEPHDRLCCCPTCEGSMK